MVGQHVSNQTHLGVMRKAASQSIQHDCPNRFSLLARVRVRSMAVNALLSSLYAVFVYANVTFFLQTGSVVTAGLLIFNTLAMVCFLARRRASEVTESIPGRTIACVTFLLPFGLRPATAPWIPLMASVLGQVAGLALMIASLVALNRSIGVVAANRGIKTGGPYAWIRHPMYAGELVFLASFVLSNWMFLNIVIVCGILVGQLVRLFHEEALLRRDQRYARYQAAVRHRLIPGIL